MTATEKIVKHIDVSIENFNALYKEYKREENPDIKARLRKALMNGAFWIAQDFNELGRAVDGDEQKNTNA